MLRIKSKPPKYLLAAAVAAASIFFIWQGEVREANEIEATELVGTIGLLLSIGLATTYEYIVLDFATGYIGKFSSVFSLFSAGGWEKLPVSQHIVLKYYAERHTATAGKYGAPKLYSSRCYVIMLSVPNSSHGFIVIEIENLAKARKTANDFSIASGLELKDYTAS